MFLNASRYVEHLHAARGGTQLAASAESCSLSPDCQSNQYLCANEYLRQFLSVPTLNREKLTRQLVINRLGKGTQKAAYVQIEPAVIF